MLQTYSRCLTWLHRWQINSLTVSNGGVNKNGKARCPYELGVMH